MSLADLLDLPARPDAPEEVPLWIGGRETASADGAVGDDVNPATATVLARHLAPGDHPLRRMVFGSASCISRGNTLMPG